LAWLEKLHHETSNPQNHRGGGDLDRCRQFTPRADTHQTGIQRQQHRESRLGELRLCHGRDTINPNTLIMLYTIAVILIVLWLLGLVTGYTMGAFIHVLLVIAIIMVLLNLITGRRV
jgi:hypothetical protein